MTKLIFIFFMFSTPGVARELSAEDREALQKTQDMLKDKKSRHQEIQKSKDAQKAHQNGIKVVGSENEEELYGVSSQVMEELVKMTGGDAQKMQALLEKAKTNPEAFYKSLSPQARDAIKKLSSKAPQ